MCLCMLDYLFVRFFCCFLSTPPSLLRKSPLPERQGQSDAEIPSNSEENKGVLFTKGNTSDEIQR